MDLQEVLQLLAINPKILVKCILSKNWQMRPITTKGQLQYQITTQEGAQAFHRNLDPQKALEQLFTDIQEHKQAQIYTTEADFHILRNKKGVVKVLRKPPSEKTADLEHNRTKNYLLSEGEPLPFLVELGIMRPDGTVVPKMRDKFLQINRFLEMISQIDLPTRLHIADLGCGKAYLTFALYHFLSQSHQGALRIVGCDLKEAVMHNCQQLAQKLGFEGLSFHVGTIQLFQPEIPIDMVVALHACDTATDDAISRGLEWKAKIICVAPCCQHELRSKLSCDPLRPLLKWGLFKEKLTALVTDAGRAGFLASKGYRVDVIEFIDPEHTPKNTLLRAVSDPKIDTEKAAEEWNDFRTFLGI